MTSPRAARNLGPVSGRRSPGSAGQGRRPAGVSACWVTKIATVQAPMTAAAMASLRPAQRPREDDDRRGHDRRPEERRGPGIPSPGTSPPKSRREARPNWPGRAPAPAPGSIGRRARPTARPARPSAPAAPGTASAAARPCSGRGPMRRRSTVATSAPRRSRNAIRASPVDPEDHRQAPEQVQVVGGRQHRREDVGDPDREPACALDVPIRANRDRGGA